MAVWLIGAPPEDLATALSTRGPVTRVETSNLFLSHGRPSARSPSSASPTGNAARQPSLAG